MMGAVVIRPEPGCAASVRALGAMGVAAAGYPLFEVEPVAWDAPAPDGFDLVLAGSANVFRHGGAGLAQYRALPVHAVGEATAEAARTAGFGVAVTGSGGLQGVLDGIPAGARVLRLAGAERVALEAPAGVTMAERVVYASVARTMTDELAAQLAGALVLLHSAEAARHFAAECDRLGVLRNGVALATIGPRVTTAAGSGWRTVATAPEPSEAALLAKARELCQDLAGD